MRQKTEGSDKQTNFPFYYKGE